MPSIVEDYIVISLFYRPIQIRFLLAAPCSVHESICSVIIELSRAATFSFEQTGKRGLFSASRNILECRSSRGRHLFSSHPLPIINAQSIGPVQITAFGYFTFAITENTPTLLIKLTVTFTCIETRLYIPIYLHRIV